MSENRIAAAYSGTDSYIFISYSHKNTPEVMSIVHRLQDEGYRVWYDEGIDPGTEWDANIAAHVKGCSYFIAFVSSAYLGSDNCKDELNYARDLNKERLLIYLEDVELPDGMAMRLNRLQAMHKYKYTSEEMFFTKLFQTPGLKDFCDGRQTADGDAPAAGAPETKSEAALDKGTAEKTAKEFAPEQKPDSVAATAAPFKLKTKHLLIGASALLVLIAGIIIAVLSGGDASQTNGDTTAPGQTEAVTMSDELLDFTFTLRGKVYQLPAPYSGFADEGWTISSSGYSESYLVAGNEREYFSMVNNGITLYVCVQNYSGDARAISECDVVGLDYYYNGTEDMVLPGGITSASDTEAIKAAYGAPNGYTDNSDYEVLEYTSDDEYSSYVKLYVDSDGCDISMMNKTDKSEQTETSTAVPEYLSAYTAPTALGTVHTDPVLSLEGELYRLPAPVSEFTDNGWEITYRPNAVAAGNNESVTLEKDGKRVDVRVHNFSSVQTLPENCAVVQVSAYGDDGVQMELSGGFAFGADKAAVESAVTEDFEIYESTYSISYSYYDYELGLQVSISVDAESGIVSGLELENTVWDYE